ncbi:hypothetical protein SEVIR_5G432850v4 [Setaria viridis]
MAEAVAAGSKTAAEEVEGKPAGAVKKTTKKLKVQVNQQYIDVLLARPPRWRSRRPIVFDHPAESQVELEFREGLLELEATLKNSEDEHDKDMAILEEYRLNGCAYEEIEVDGCDEVVMNSG